MTWRERIAQMEAEGREPNRQERQLLKDWPTCFVGEQVARGLIPADWQRQWAEVETVRYDVIADLGLGVYRLSRVELSDRLDRIEDEALKIKCELAS